MAATLEQEEKDILACIEQHPPGSAERLQIQRQFEERLAHIRERLAPPAPEEPNLNPNEHLSGRGEDIPSGGS